MRTITLRHPESPDATAPEEYGWWAICRPGGQRTYAYGAERDADRLADAYNRRDRLDNTLWAAHLIDDPDEVAECEHYHREDAIQLDDVDWAEEEAEINRTN